ncbi:MAG: alcohol dehydrogenase catalytic domain-containing protein [Armatimonadota bacterium]|nr:alcohol dehydrogenase catalytic domain-containing protein [Armatimonadota bacterium]MDR7564029.1 alcohol dehydrogenase catalytic domain-containing protein [Armatimonadota bacterium]MDR7602845.1 alcohol dehydrogenase catalytic domain-containing protein [Armatimonadota bacterium]
MLVRVLGCGVCHSDVSIADGRFSASLPLVPGHEVAGYAEGLGNVLVYASWGCGRCAFCGQGEEQLCPEGEQAGWTRDGGYAEWLRVPSARYLVPLGGLDPVRAAPLADAGLTPYRAVRRALPWLREGATALVVGAGGLGQFAVQYLKLLSLARVVAVERDRRKFPWVLELGADRVVRPTEEVPPARAVFDFVGSSASLRLGLKVLEPGGILVQVGAAGGHVPFGFDRVPPEVHLTNSVWGSLGELHEVVELAQSGKLRWHVETLPLERANEALDRLRGGRVLGRLVLVS